MREACLYNKWSFVPIFLFLYRALMRWTHWIFWGEVTVMSPHDGDTHLEWGVECRRMRALPNSFGWEFILLIKTHFYGGARTSHFMEEHSSPTSTFPVFMLTSSNGNMFCVTGFYAGNSPVTGEFPSHRPMARVLMFSLLCASTNGWVNNQDAGDLRRHRADHDVTVMWCRTVIQWSGQPWALSAFNASLLSNFELVKRVKLGGSVHYGRNGLTFGTLLCPDYHSLKLTIFLGRK